MAPTTCRPPRLLLLLFAIIIHSQNNNNNTYQLSLFSYFLPRKLKTFKEWPHSFFQNKIFCTAKKPEKIRMNKIKIERIEESLNWTSTFKNAKIKEEQIRRNCRCLIDTSSPAALERDFYAWLNVRNKNKILKGNNNFIFNIKV